jgi:hypothetical protein
MTELEQEQAPERTMTEREEEIALRVQRAWQSASGLSQRSLQAQNFKVGISDLGWCSERTRRMLDKQEPDEEDYTKAFIGTAIGDHLEKACGIWWPGGVTQAEVTVTLRDDEFIYRVNGHPDLIRPDDGLVVDFKASRGLGTVMRTGPTQQQQFQRHCYAKGAHESGLFPGWDLADLTVANVWFDRTGDSSLPYVHAEPYSEEVVQQATWWLSETVYAFTHEQESRKEPPREMCQKVCGFFRTCRAHETDVQGLLTDDTVLASVDMYQEALALEKQAKALKDEARSHLSGITGSTGEFAVRWTWVNGSHVSYDRNGYERLSISRLK